MSEAAAEFGDGGPPVDAGGSWSGPSAEDWASTQEAIGGTQSALGEIAQLLSPEEGPPAFDPFVEDGGRAQLEEMIRAETAPIDAWVQQERERAALEGGHAEAERIISETAQGLGASVDEGEVANAAEDGVQRFASESVLPDMLARAGYSPQQVAGLVPALREQMKADPFSAYMLIAEAFDVPVEDVAKAALVEAVKGAHFEATKARSPSEVLAKYTKAQPVRESRADQLTPLAAQMLRRIQSKGGRR